jgi:hypothetical protein
MHLSKVVYRVFGDFGAGTLPRQNEIQDLIRRRSQKYGRDIRQKPEFFR